MADLLQQGIAAARAGKRAEARALLTRVVEADERNEQAWLWLAGVVDDPQDMRTCLHNVLDLNPANQRARQGLAWIDSRYGTPAPPPEPPRQEPLPPPAQLAERAVAAPEPAARSSPTGTTARLDADAAMNATAEQRPSPAPPTLPATPIVAAPAAHPCPYCGAPTVLTQRSCTQCRGDLLIRTAPPEHRSLALTMLGVLWGIGGALILLLTVFMAFLFLIARQSGAAGQRGSTDALMVGIAFTFVFGLLYIGLARGLLARRRWAYYANVLLTAINLFNALAGILAGAALVAALSATLGRERSAGASTIALIVIMLVLVAFVLLPIALTILSYNDFFGPKVRFTPAVEPADHRDHYNNGVAYKNRGMWYMAAQEWEAAIGKQPREPSYLHALGLAYAQLKQYDRARAALDTAIHAAPDNQQIKESRALVDQMATKK